MSPLTRRLHILLDDERYARIWEEAERRGVAVAVVVREAIDSAFPSGADARARAMRSLLSAPPMAVPDDPADLTREIADTRSRWG